MCEHKWIVYSTSLCPPSIMVKCKSCKGLGYIEEFESHEWSKAYHAPSSPYTWKDDSRVTR